MDDVLVFHAGTKLEDGASSPMAGACSTSPRSAAPSPRRRRAPTRRSPDRLAGGLLPARHRLAGRRADAERGLTYWPTADMFCAAQAIVEPMTTTSFPASSIAPGSSTEAGRIFARSKRRGPPLVLLHGFPQTHAMWHRIAPALAETHPVVCMDLRGYGWSSAPRGDPSTRPIPSAPWAAT